MTTNNESFDNWEHISDPLKRLRSQFEEVFQPKEKEKESKEEKAK